MVNIKTWANWFLINFNSLLNQTPLILTIILMLKSISMIVRKILIYTDISFVVGVEFKIFDLI
jgi:hypothetical protein